MKGEQDRLIEEVSKVVRKKWSCLFWVLMAPGVLAFLWGCAHVVDVKVCCFEELLRASIKAQKIGDFYGLTLALSSVVATVVVFFYTILDGRRMGVENRRIVAYRVGAYTVPVLFALTLVLLFLACFLKYAGCTVEALINSIYVFVLEMFIIVEILKATSFRKNVGVIRKVEEEQLELTAKEGNFDLWIYMVHHMELIAAAENIFLEKSELTRELLRVPFNVEEEYKKDPLRWKEVIYQYYYMNLTGFLGRVGERGELEQAYEILYQFAEELQDRVREGSVREEECLLINSAILNAALDDSVVREGAFCAQFISRCVGGDMRDRQIVLFFLFHELMYRNNIIAVNDAVVRSLRLSKEMECVLRDMGECCVEFWEVWTLPYALSEETSVAGCSVAFRTLAAKEPQHIERQSLPIVYIKDLRGEYRGWRYAEG